MSGLLPADDEKLPGHGLAFVRDTARRMTLCLNHISHYTIGYAEPDSASRRQHVTQAISDVNRVADLLQVNAVAIRCQIKDGEIGAIYSGSGWRIGQEDSDAFREGLATRPAARPDGGTNASADATAEPKRKEQKN